MAVDGRPSGFTGDPRMIWARFEFIGKMEHTKLSSGKDK
jgi:hypothetical protein